MIKNLKATTGKDIWYKEVSLEEACELYEEVIHEESAAKSKWSEHMRVVTAYEESPTGYVSFGINVPRNHEMGLFESNEGEEFILIAVEQIEVVTKQWVEYDRSAH